jgi:CubicO group peptidase (beta-lactamase class C family)
MRLVRWSRWLVLALVVIIVLALGVAVLVYPPQYVFRVLVWQESDAFDWQKFPYHPLHAAPVPHPLPVALDPRVETLFADLAETDDWIQFLAEQQTQSFLVVQDGTIRYEQYFNDTTRDSIVTSFSVAKSYVSTLIGFAIEEGYIESVDDSITRYLPELAAHDPRFEQIKIRDLLRMASGLDYQEFRPLLLTGDDPLTTYYPDQRKIALENPQIIVAPGTRFHYNKYHPQLLGLILERTTGMTPTEYLQTRLWDRLGMEYDGSWSVDSVQSDFEKMETGVNGRAVDFAKLGQLFLDNGQWQGQQVISAAWVAEATQPWQPADPTSYYPTSMAALPGQPYYAYMWWGFARPDGSYDYTAAGDKGQYIYVSPAHRLVLVLRFVDDLTVGEIARLIGRSIHATESLLVRARRELVLTYRGPQT